MNKSIVLVLFIFFTAGLLQFNPATSQPAVAGHPSIACCDSIHPALKATDPFHRCGSTLYKALQETQMPELKILREQLETQSLQWIKDHADYLKHQQQSIIIPVVVHVVYNVNKPEQNITEAQILSQIDALNRDFSRQNADTANTPSVFKDLAADAQIEFRMAVRTPDGLPTNGITRTATSVQAFSMENDDVKFDYTGGRNIWNRDQYLNFWVCNLESSYLGYAQYPGGPAPTDGIVVSYKNFGTSGTAQFPFNQGRTVTHEVGHWLNLVHIWGDEDNCSATDFVADTPNQEIAYYHCPAFPQSSCDSHDMFMNYMDYTDDRCMNLFTQGQKNRMHSTLNGFRASIKISTALLEPDITQLWCDTLNKAMLSEPLFLYTAEAGGYATGTNSYNDRAKAQYFDNPDSFTLITGGEVAFGKVNDAGGYAVFAIWKKEANNKPSRFPMAQKLIPLADIIPDVANSRHTSFIFDTPVKISGPFFAGIILPPSTTDTLALLASGYTDIIDAWEQWSDETWMNFKDAWEGSLNVNLAVFPLVCKEVPQYDPGKKITLRVAPNPVFSNYAYLYFSQFLPEEQVEINIYDITGRNVLRKIILNPGNFVRFEFENVNLHGLYIMTVSGEAINIRTKFLIFNQPTH